MARSQKMKRISRRTFIGGAAAVTLTPAPTPTREKLYEFNYSDVKLTAGPLKAQFDRVHAHFLGLDNDRLLKVYRQRAGLPAPGEDMGGWYDKDGFVPGHTIGQYKWNVRPPAIPTECCSDCPACHDRQSTIAPCSTHATRRVWLSISAMPRVVKRC